MFGNGGNNVATQGAITRAELYEGFNNNQLDNGIRGLANGLCDGFYDINTNMIQGFNGVNSALCNLGYSFKDCCCETNRNIDAIRYENAKNTCEEITNTNMNTRDIIASQTAGFQRILDAMQQDKIDALRAQLQDAHSQITNLNQTSTIINAVRPFPQPAYVTCSPYTPVPPAAA